MTNTAPCRPASCLFLCSLYVLLRDKWVLMVQHTFTARMGVALWRACCSSWAIRAGTTSVQCFQVQERLISCGLGLKASVCFCPQIISSVVWSRQLVDVFSKITSHHVYTWGLGEGSRWQQRNWRVVCSLTTRGKPYVVLNALNMPHFVMVV